MPHKVVHNEPIAIIGSACRFAGDANTPSKLWDLLREPGDLRQEIPNSRFSVKGFYHPNHAHHGHINVKHSYLLNEDPSAFDAEFFGINPIEARAMDPQQRLLLETVFEAVDSAGMTIEGLQGSDTAVYAGVMTGDYEAMLLRDVDAAPTYVAVGTSRAVLSNRISYFFDWHGASVTMDTACSSSLVAVHSAIQTLRSGDSRMAVACGANVILGPENYIIESKVKMLSPDGVSRMWDKDANGYARGDGVAAIVLKPLSAALEDNDHIECIIRETGLNQDGRTTGLTMPSATAQRDLILSTYAKAGLDLTAQADRPQFFEAHGTGTPAGGKLKHPVEAEAISSAFFGGERGTTREAGGDPLFVGSIKTVLGHTEGTAGIAAILKAMLAIQNSCIPPNLLFDHLSPSVAPFYEHLEILRAAKPWPNLPKGQPRRASVNSFGFGGANAHAILESYEKPIQNGATNPSRQFTPFVFSAASEQSLRANLLAYVEHLEVNPAINLHNLAYTLRERRSVFPYRISFPATDVNELKSKILASLEDQGSGLGVRTLSGSGKASKILGVFTGQGAQYARMGAELISQSPLAQQIIRELEAHLNQLPEEDPGIYFDAVVGHSGGEVAAAYAAGFLTARDALSVAHYRGMNCKLAASPNGNVKGAMLAVGTTMEDAMQLCEEDDFAGRITLAAVNSSSSVTISGDEDAIEELAAVMEQEKKFNRRLKVDNAYHSKHMLPAAGPYIEGVRRAGVKAMAPSLPHPCTWYSSVYDGKPVDESFGLSDVYWAENMVRPVLFSQALTSALSSGTVFDAMLEVGPHPALKSPASQTTQDVLQKPIPYQGTLLRNSDATEAFSTSLGFLWSHLNKGSVNLGSGEVALSGGRQQFQVLKGLPTYQWGHETKYWHESRRSRHMRLRQQPFHPLLGDATPDNGPHVLRWKNILKPSELQWVEGHSVQGQLVFPAAGYAATAFEAAQFLTGREPIRLIELEDLYIHQAVTFPGNDMGVEVLIELSQVSKARPDCIMAKFTYSAALSGDSTDLSLAADGVLKVSLGDPSSKLLPERQPEPPHMITVEESRLYNYMETLEYSFSGPFRSLVELKRKLGRAFCVAKRTSTPDRESVLVHPAELDAAFQSINLAYSYPGDEQLRNLHLPTSIAKIRVNPVVLTQPKQQEDGIGVDSTCNPGDRSAPGSGFSGNVNMYFHGYSNAAIQIDQVNFKPVGMAANDDRKVFCKMDLVPSKPDGQSAAESIQVTQHETDLMWCLSRIVNFYVRQFDAEVPEDAPCRSESPLCHYLNYVRHMRILLERGENKFAKQKWLNDTLEDVMEDIHTKGVANNADVRIMLLVGETMPRVFRGETDMLEHFRTSGLLDEYYAHGFGTMQSAQWLANSVKQITDRHPHLRLLEIGAGTGGATKYVLPAIDRSFDSYTYTDVSASFFENAAETFMPWEDRLVFKTCDIEQDPTEQGFVEGTYDVIVACQVLHATTQLDRTIHNLRWGAGVGEGRTLSPLASVSQWDALLSRNGFSGIDTMSPPKLFDTFGLTLLLSQAVDTKMEIIRNPLSSSENLTIDEVVILGGQTQPVTHLVQGLETIFRGLGVQVYVYETIEEVDLEKVTGPGTSIISLADLDRPVLQGIMPYRWKIFKKLFEGEKTVLWLTKGRLEDEPYCNATVGFGRVARHEEDDLRLQFLDVPDATKIDARAIAETFVRLSTKRIGDESILYTVEPEIFIDGQGREMVPRLGHISAANNRLNSTRRPIVHEVDVQKSVVELQQDGSGCFLRQLSRYEISQEIQGSKIIEMRTTHAVLSALKTPIGYRFLVIGVDPIGRRYLALVSSLTSVLKVPEEATLPCATSSFPDALLTLIAAQLIAMAIVDSTFPGQKVAIHNASDILAQAIAAQASVKGVATIFTTDRLDVTSIPSSFIKIPPYLGRSDLSQIIPADIACFVGLSPHESENELSILSFLSPYCRKENAKTLYSPHAVDTGTAFPAILGQILERAAKHLPKEYELTPKEVSLGTLLTANEYPDEPLTVVDWTTDTSLPTRVTRIDTKPLFKSDKTYWLCGLSGALGISLCDWMIERGMRYLVLTSRNPKVDPKWIEDHKRNNIFVKIMPCDVTNEKALRAVHQAIVKTLPPIVGVLNGAMVLRDVTVRNMTYDQLTEVVKPKVLGSIHLDRIFYDVDLDFFVLLSSANCVIGNVGQANYAAANMGMCGVAANRRKRGLRSSVANVGAIIGVGYITQNARQLDLTVANTHLIHLNEEDFHQIAAEVIETGHHDSPLGPEITTGLLEVAADEPNMPKWFSDPKFARLIVNRNSGGDDKANRVNEASIQESLQGCRSEQDVFEVVKHAFATQLRQTLQISTPDDDMMKMRSSNLGLDSLISVDIRSWFLKHFQVSIPVLKIMATDAQMAGLVDAVVEGIPLELIPQVAGREKGVATINGDDSASGTASSGVTPGSAVSGHSLSTDATSTDGDGPIDWDAEAQPPDIKDVTHLPGVEPPNPKPSVVLLTGASGLLGHHLLNALVAQPSIRKVICIAIRRLSERLKANELPPPSDRIVYYEGDLSLPRFGLSEEDHDSIFSEVDAIIHNGADTSHLKYYSAVRDTNVTSTKRLVLLCLQRMIPMHYVSSAGMALFAGKDPFPEVSGIISGVKPPADGQHGYMSSKWVCENMLEQVNAAHGLKVWIQRPSTIVREGDDATTDKADFDWVNTLIKYSHRIRAVPKVEHNKGAFDLVYVQTVCDDIVGELLRNKPRQGNGVTYVNNVGDQVIPMDRMDEIAKQKGEKDLYPVLPWDQWVRRAIAAGLHPAVAALVEKFDEPGGPSYPGLSRARA
ncbi:hypothetical protein DL768_010897 [Monosporascus sp. mg162]|nr:hypothetical protein DL768_010897 [Monosporascus sp. mg162]